MPNGAWPSDYDNSYLYSDYVCGKIFQLKPNGAGGFAQTDFVSGLGEKSAVTMIFGPHGADQALYYTTLGDGGEVRRIAHTGTANRPPIAALAANLTSGPLQLAVAFDGSGSGDPDTGDTLTTYLWDFGDGSATQTTTAPTTSHTYSTKGTYTASLRVKDNHGALSDPDTVRIDAGNEAPHPSIGSPSADLRFAVGQQITLRGSATDHENGQLPESSFEWEVLRHHNGDHTHPYFSGTGNDLTLTAPPPEGIGSTSAGNYLEIKFTATDSEGLSETVVRELQPNRVGDTFESNPSGLSLQADGQTFAAPRTLVSWEGYKLSLTAPSAQTLSGKIYVFASWSDGKGQTHDIVTGAAPSTYTATFKACTKTGTANAETISGTSADDVICAGGGNDTIKGLGGNDILKGEDGNDTLLGGIGNDTLDGGLNTDSASYSASLTGVIASLATNSSTGEGSDTFSGVENLLGSPKPDTLTGSTTNNKLTGGGANDTESGGAGNDTVIGSGGADILKGEDGADTVNSKDGVSGNDTLDGGAGTDTKVTDATEKSLVGFP